MLMQAIWGVGAMNAKGTASFVMCMSFCVMWTVIWVAKA